MHNPHVNKGLANKLLVLPKASIKKDLLDGKQMLNIINQRKVEESIMNMTCSIQEGKPAFHGPTN